MRELLSFLCVAGLHLLTVPQAASQTADKPSYWLGLGVGKTKLPSGMVALGYEPARNNTVIIARYSLSAEILQPIEPGVKVNELGFLYGIRIRKFHLSTGISRVWGNDRGAYVSTNPTPLVGSGARYEFLGYSTIGIPGEIRFIASGKHVGFGITGYGNLNQKQSFAGLNLVLYLGSLNDTGLPGD